MGNGVAIETRFGSPLWRHGAIALVVAGVHVVAFLGLLAMRIVEDRLFASPREAMTYITLPPLVALKLARPKNAHKGRGGSSGAYFNPHTFGRMGPNAITIVQVKPPVVGPEKRCPTPLRPGSPEWKRRCEPIPPPIKYDDGSEDFSLVPRDSPAFRQWEAEQKKRHAPVRVPCSYVRKDPPMFGPHESSSAMVNLGCAAKELFDH